MVAPGQGLALEVCGTLGLVGVHQGETQQERPHTEDEDATDPADRGVAVAGVGVGLGGVQEEAEQDQAAGQRQHALHDDVAEAPPHRAAVAVRVGRAVGLAVVEVHAAHVHLQRLQ